MRMFLAAVAIMSATPLIAQTPIPAAPASSADTVSQARSREYQLDLLQHRRRLLLSMADSMPEHLYRDKATPTQRDFARQMHHAAAAATLFVQRAMKGPRAPAVDTTKALNSRAGLQAMVNTAFDYMEAVLRSQSDSARRTTVALSGRPVPMWRVWDVIDEHTVWTAGQMVGNFRKHGTAPPAFSPF